MLHHRPTHHLCIPLLKIWSIVFAVTRRNKFLQKGDYSMVSSLAGGDWNNYGTIKKIISSLSFNLGLRIKCKGVGLFQSKRYGSSQAAGYCSPDTLIRRHTDKTTIAMTPIKITMLLSMLLGKCTILTSITNELQKTINLSQKGCLL